MGVFRVITNTFIAIAEQGFMQTKRVSRFQWLKATKEEELPSKEEGKRVRGLIKDSE
jgi:hypothetical protein